MTEIKTVAVVGTGVIGAGWATRCLVHGFDVVATDPGPQAEEKLRASIDNAWPAALKLVSSPAPEPGTLSFTTSLAEAMEIANFVQESAPEREELKQKLFADMDAMAAAQVIIASSTSGYMPTVLQANCAKHPERVIVGHPFNPVYLLPLVEVVPGVKSSDDAVARAADFYERIGMHALKVRNEIDGHLSDRLQEALWREVLHLVNDGVATTGELDDAIIYGPGLRWALMGTNLTFHLAGGEHGMRHMLEQFGPALKLPWTKLVAPELSDTLIDRMVDGTQAQAQGRSIRELERLRDACLVDIMRTLQRHKIASGLTLARDEEKRRAAAQPEPWGKGQGIEAPLSLYKCLAPPEGTAAGGHLSESFAAQVSSEATQAFLSYAGIDIGADGNAGSFVAQASHYSAVAKFAGGTAIKVATRLLGHTDEALHLLHEFYGGNGKTLLAVSEQRLAHVNVEDGEPCAMDKPVLQTLEAIERAHAALARSDHAGCAIEALTA